MIYRFGACTMDVSRRLIERHGAPVHVEPQAFALLHYLVENRGRAVTKEELFAEIWGGRAVSDAVLTTRIRGLRRALDEPGNVSVIRTLHRVGYEFSAKVREERAQHDPASAKGPGPGALQSARVNPPDEVRHVVVIALQPRLPLDQPFDPEQFDQMHFAARTILSERLHKEHDAIVESADGTLFALIGVRITRADDLRRAARLALALADTASTGGTQVALAIATGNVARVGETFRGDALLIAAQTVAQARSGEVLLSASVANRMPEGASAEFDGDLARLTGCREDHGSDSSATPFVGRAVELGLIDSALSAMLENASGGCITLEGAAGIGKSRLAQRAVKMIEDLGGRHSLVHIRELGADGTLHRGIMRGFLPLIGDPAPYLAAAALEARPALQRLLEGAETRDAVIHSEPLGAAIAGILRRVSVDVPLIVVVEDVHWIDEQSRKLVLELAQICAEMQVILLVTARPSAKSFLEDIAARADGDIVALTLGPLSRRQSLSLVQALAPDIDEQTGERLVDRAGGNALFLTRLVEAYLEQGRASLEAVPGSIQSVVQVQFDQLDKARQGLLRKISILGERLEKHVAGIVYGDAVARDAPTAGFLRASGTWLQFTHNLVRESIYASIPRAERERLHTEAANALVGYDPLLAAEHAILGDLSVAPSICVRVARDTFHFRRTGRSVELIERATKLDCTPDQRAQLEIFLGSSKLELYDEAAALAHYREAAAWAQSSTPGVFAQVRIARVNCRRYDLAAASAALDRADAWVEKHPGPGYLGSEIAETRSVVAWLGRDLDEGVRKGEEAVSLSDHPHSTGRALKTLSLSYFSQARFATARQTVDACLALIEEKTLRLVEPEVLGPALRIRWYADPGDHGLAEANALVSRADETGVRQARLHTRSVRLEIAWELGDREAFARDLEALRAELLPQHRLTWATVAFFEALQQLRDGREPALDSVSAGLPTADPPAFLPLNWLHSRFSRHQDLPADIDPTPHESLWLARLQRRLADTGGLALDRPAFEESGAWRRFAAAHEIPPLP